MATQISEALKKSGFKVVESTSPEYSFDLVAGRETEVFALKMVEEVGRGLRKIISDLKKLSRIPSLYPLLICQEGLPEDMVYTFMGVPFIDYRTFRDVLKSAKIPFIYSHRGGVYVKLRGDKVREKRLEHGMSLSEMAYRLGVSRRMVYEYETSKSDATPEVAARLIDLFGEEVVECLSLESIKGTLQIGRVSQDLEEADAIKDPDFKVIYRLLENMGFWSLTLSKTPFQMISGDQTGGRFLLIRKSEGETEDELTTSVARLSGTRAVLLTRDEDEKVNDHVVKISRRTLEAERSRDIVKRLLG